MNLLRFFRPTNPARELSLIGHERRKADVRAVARQMRAELGLGDDERLA